jgi:signal transduction histidine kinase/ActR/RegA family two-component response regulator
MMSAAQASPGQIAILAPTGKDGALTANVLKDAGIETVVCRDFSCLQTALEEGVDVLLIAEESLDNGNMAALLGALRRQPAWSDVPLLLIARHEADSITVETALACLGNVTLLERPVRPATLITAARTALKSRARQYEVREYLAERERTAKALQEADERKDEFLATLAHELRNPLAPIRNSLQILRLSAAVEPGVEQICETLERQTGLLIRLVDDLLEVSRISQGKIELRKELVELAAVIRQAVEISKPFIDSFGHNLTIAIPAEPVVIDGDVVRLSQVFCNLLNNAAKYTNHGGQIWLSAKRKDQIVSISVKDTGIGIPADKLPRVFDMFTQVDRTSRQAQGGLGIGLSLVRALVEMHGGKVEAISGGVNCGSEFIVTLPLSNETPVTSSESKPTGPLVLPHRRVLVVDDNRDAALSLSRLLRLLGAEVETVHDGPSALKLMQSYRPAVVLLDIGMPNMDGYEVARRIRSDPDFAAVQLIALTGWGQQQDRDRTAEAGFNHHLVKPADIDAIESLLALDEQKRA